MPAYKDKERGTWYISCVYRDWTGKKCHKLKRGFKKKPEALAWERDFMAKSTRAMDMRFDDFCKIYEKDRKPRLKLNTWLTKEYIIREKLLPYFGDKAMCDITPSDVIDWQNELMAFKDKHGEGYSQTYLRTVNNQLSAIFNHAVRFYGLMASPVSKAGKMGSTKGTTMDYWTREEYLAFSDKAMVKATTFYAFEILYWTGIREGELLALTPADFDFDKLTLSITKSYQRLKGEDVITDPKTPKSNRVIALPKTLATEIQEYLESLEGIQPDQRMFTFSKSHLANEMARAAEAAGVKRIRIHDLRHSHVSMLIEMGFSALAIAERMGHESIDITYRYAHLFPHKQSVMAEVLDDWRQGGTINE